MNGREDKNANDLFFTCSLIDYIARKTNNKRRDVVNLLGKERIEKIYRLANVYHCENIDEVSDSFIEEADIPCGTFDNIAAAQYAVPSYWDIGKVYKRLVLGIARHEQIDIPEAVIKGYNSYVSGLIDDYNCGFYYDAPEAILNAYLYPDPHLRGYDKSS